MCDSCFGVFFSDEPPMTGEEIAAARVLAAMFTGDMHWGPLHIQIEDDNYDIDVDVDEWERAVHAQAPLADRIAAAAWNAAPHRVRAYAVGIHNGYALT